MNQSDENASNTPRKLVEQLKTKWVKNPTWILENTEGYESYYHELLEYRLRIEAQADALLLKEQIETAKTLDLTLEDAVVYIEESEKYHSNKGKAKQMLANLLDSSRNVKSVYEIEEFVDVLFAAIDSRTRCLKMSDADIDEMEV
ncbi:hypothetical protein [Myxosarcina sp. GI1]|uniref:hypothetical protein n=1 Tax=Myxosarcina sp. GI1 TaxID=1541065 RepID=UPI000569896B|nr:hypothetical protein [Myxosarcina sp. GI1]